MRVTAMNRQIETKLQFPQGFLLGAASSAHQVEGNNTNSDWWELEQMGRLPKSGLAADHYHRYAEDFALAQSIGLNAMRISIEWSRMEPIEGKWAVAEVEHYKKVLRLLKELRMSRLVTLFHFTLPQWVAHAGGMETSRGIQAFARFAWFVAQNLGSEIDFWVTINEPEIYAAAAYNRGVFPPFRKKNRQLLTVFHNLIRAHRAAYRAIKEVRPQAQVGLAKNSTHFEPARRRNYLDQVAAWFLDRVGNHYFLENVRHHLDFIGLNYYFSRTLSFQGRRGWRSEAAEGPKTDLSWPIYPEGIYYLLKDLKKYGKPIYITENGLADAADANRRQFIYDHLVCVKKAMDSGADVRGYFYWSLTDTYEWETGFKPKFGLVEVDFETQQRRIRASAKIFKELA